MSFGSGHSRPCPSGPAVTFGMAVLAALATAPLIGVRWSLSDGSAELRAYYQPVTSFLLWHLSTLPLLAAAVGAAFAVRALWRSGGSQRRWACLGLAALTWTLAAHFSLPLAERSLRHAAYRRLAQRAAPVVAAIRRYEAEHGSSPPTLRSLVPGYLAAVPGTGLRSQPRFSYRGPQPCALYDVHVVSRPAGMALNEVRSVRVVYDSSGRVDGAELVDSVAELPPAVPFDRSRWHRGSGDGAAMLADLLARGALIGKSRAQVDALLGPGLQDTRRPSAGWELRVSTTVAPYAEWLCEWDRVAAPTGPWRVQGDEAIPSLGNLIGYYFPL
ncbi:MAG: hypothetical protein HYU66_03710 [Armatimonadetes bacterium]|nr:hypothetical protein [Armatimonadota bacterium]